MQQVRSMNYEITDTTDTYFEKYPQQVQVESRTIPDPPRHLPQKVAATSSNREGQSQIPLTLTSKGGRNKFEL